MLIIPPKALLVLGVVTVAPTYVFMFIPKDLSLTSFPPPMMTLTGQVQEHLILSLVEMR